MPQESAAQLAQAVLERRPKDYEAFDLSPNVMSILLGEIGLTAGTTLDALLDATILVLLNQGWVANYRLSIQPNRAPHVTFNVKRLGR